MTQHRYLTTTPPTRRSVLQWIRLLGVASERHLRLATGCHTWRRQERLAAIIRSLVAHGYAGIIPGSDGHLFYAGQEAPQNLTVRRGLADLTVAVHCSLRARGYPSFWVRDADRVDALAGQRLVLWHDSSPVVRRAVLVQYHSGRLQHGTCSDMPDLHVALGTDGSADEAQAVPCVLASCDVWPIASGERWLSAVVRRLDDDRLYIANHVFVLDTWADDVLAAVIWHNSRSVEPTRVYLRDAEVGAP